jgi:hypothetical protein
MTGGAMTGGATTGGAMTGGAMTGGAMTGGESGMSTGGTMAGGSGAGMGGAGMGGNGGAGGSAAGSGGKGESSSGAGGSAGKGGTGGKGGSAGGGGTPTVLSHRYSFEGTGMQAMDSIGTAHGTITGGMQASGRVTLSGTDQYVTLPSTILNGLSATTLEMWVTWTGTTNWQRLFDFGENGEDTGDQGSFSANASSSYFFFTPRAGASDTPGCTGAGNTPLVSMTGSGPSMETCILNAPAFPTGATHVALAINASAMRLYINGTSAGMATPPVPLNGITASHNWLGRSQYAQDPEFQGSIDEFRIYPTARTAAQITASEAAGPGSVPTQ